MVLSCPRMRSAGIFMGFIPMLLGACDRIGVDGRGRGQCNLFLSP